MKNSIFDTQIDRNGTGAIKWAWVERLYGSGDVLPMWVADMDLPAPGPVIRALTERLEHPVYGYTDAGPGVKAAVTGRMRRLYDWEPAESDLIFMPGVVPSMAVAVQAFSRPGDGIILQPPVYPPFFSMISEAERRIVENPLVEGRDGRFEIDFDDLEQKAREAKILLLCSPHNPTGRVWQRDELERILSIAERHDLIIVSDEIHGEIVYPGFEHLPFAALGSEAAARTVSCIAASKTFNVAGLATSVTIISDADLRSRYRKSVGTITGHANLFGLTALEAAFTHCDQWLDELMGYLSLNRKRTVEFIAGSCPGLGCSAPEATFLAWLDCRELKLSDKALADFFAREAKVGLNPGVSFGRGGEGFMRLNFGTTRALLDEGLERIAAALNRL